MELSKEAKVFISILDEMRYTKSGWVSIWDLPIKEEFTKTFLEQNKEKYRALIIERYKNDFLSEKNIDFFIRLEARDEATNTVWDAIRWLEARRFVKTMKSENKFGVTLDFVAIGKDGEKVAEQYRRAGAQVGRYGGVKKF